MAEQNPQDRIAELELHAEELSNQMAALKSSNASLEASNKELADALELERASIKTLVEQLDAANAEAALQLKIASEMAEREKYLEAEVLKLQDKNARYENPTFEHSGNTYEITAKKANIPGKGLVTAADIAGTPELQDYLVSRGSGLIRKKA